MEEQATIPKPQGNGAWVEVDRLQAMVDEIAAAFGLEPHKVKGVKLPVASDPFVWSRREILVSEEGLPSMDLARFRGEVAETYWEISVNRSSPYLKPLQVALFAFFFVWLPVMLLKDSLTPIARFWAVTSLFVPGVLCWIWLFNRHSRWAARRLASEPVLRKLLEVTHDVARTRKFLVTQKSTPEELAKFDALVREIGLDSPKPKPW